MKWALLLFCAGAASAQVLSIGAPQAAVVAGAQMTLSPLLRDAGGNLIPASDWVWTSLDPALLSIDTHGTVAGLGLGTGTIKLTAPKEAGTLFATLQIEVQPASVSVSPALATVNVGAALQLTATALDANGNAISKTPFVWDITAEDGRPNLVPAGTTVSADGKFRSTSAGHYTVHALIEYLPVQYLVPSHFEALSEIDVVVPAAFQMDRLISSDPVPAKKLLPAPGVFVGSEAGAMAFTASADGLATAVIAYEGGAAHAVATTGSPSPQPGGVIAGFQSIAMNSLGQSLIAIKAGDRANGALLARTPQSSQFVLLDEAAGTDLAGNPINFLSYLSLTPYCLNDNGTAVIKALHLPQDAAPTDMRDGIFILKNALSPQITPLLIWSADKSLPSVPVSGTPARVQFILDNTVSGPGWAGLKGLGIDNRENVYFMAQSGVSRGLFQVAAGGTPQKIVAVGDVFLTSKVKDIQDLIVMGSGDVAVRVDTLDGNPHLTLYRAGARVNDLVVQGNPNPRILAASSAGMLFEGVPGIGKPEALYFWDYRNAATSVLSLGANAIYISTATIDSKGKALAVVRTTSNDFIVTQVGGGVVLSAGADANLVAAPDLKSLVRGARSALPSVLMSDPSSVFDLDGAGHANPRVVLGQTLGNGVIFGGAANVVEDSAGAQYFVSANTLFRSSGGTVTQLLAANTKASDGVLLTPRTALGANTQGAVLVDCGTTSPDNQRRVYTLKNGVLTQVTHTKTAFGGRQITDFADGAVDDSGNVVLILALDDGSHELVHWAGSSATSVSNTRSQFLGEPVAAFDRLRAQGSSFFVRIALTADFTHAAVVRFTASSMQPLVRSGDALPDGTLLGDLRLTDYNKNGDAIFTSTAQLTGTQVLGFRGAAGGLSIVAANNDALQTGDYLARFSDTNLRDDGAIYFLGFDVNDRSQVFRAKPVTSSTPLVASGGIVNAADFRADTLTPGAWFSIYGANLGRQSQWAGDPNTFTLGGASVTVCGAPVTLSYNSGSQINGLLPDSLAGQTSCVVAVTVNGQVSPGVNVPIAGASLLLFQFSGSSSGLLPVVTHLDYSVVGAAADGLQPAKAGEVLLAWGTGDCNNPTLTVGGNRANILFSGRVAQGLCQINFGVPAGLSGKNSMVFGSSTHQYSLWIR